MEQGISLGKRQDLTGGGLIRSIGGWTEVKQRGLDHVMSDERVLGDSAFVEDLLSQADEQYERRYQLKRLGYDADWIAGKVAKIYDMDPDEFFSKGKQQRKVKARSLFCFWAVKELGMSLREVARRLEMSPPAVGYAVERGETIARENEYRLID
jgi:hypothetical protein